MACLAVVAVFWNLTSAPSGNDRRDGGFEVLGAVSLVEDRGNDGDSFRIQHGIEEDVFRLYFVDTCEKSERFKSRLKYQAEYFGGIRLEQVIKLGEEAREVTLDWLRHEPFEIYTKRENVMKSDRLHAMVRFPKAENTDREWLCQRLVSAGLARIYTRGTTLADGTSERSFQAALRDLEAVAKREKRGAWLLKR